MLTCDIAQLQGNIRRVQDASGMRTRRDRASAKPCNKAAARCTRVPHPFLPDVGHV